ncbi:MAG: CHAT domain-containing protein [Leptolyngbyaceae cyanobacterium RU_5_1]|nr:CHAT domain-containing protein [Leptolyngbyaceae cyanobacterium RU_5_1]
MAIFRFKANDKRKKINRKRQTVKTFLFWFFLLPCFCLLLTARGVVAELRDNLPPTPPILGGFQTVQAAIPDGLEQGHTLYVAGRFSEAATVWQQAVQTFQKQGDRPNHALSLSYLSLAYQKLGQWEQAEQAIATSLDLIQNSKPVLAQALNTQGSLQLAMGKPEAALENWQQAEKVYVQVGDETGKLGCQINQAQALQTLGLYRRAQSLLQTVNAGLQTQPDSTLKALGLKSLGTVLQVTGNLQDSQKILEQSLAIAQRLNPPLNSSDIQFNLGNTLRALQATDKALQLYQQSAAAAPTAIARIRTQLNHLSLLIDTKQWQAAQALIAQIQPQMGTLPASRESIYARVNFADSLMQIRAATGRSDSSPQALAQLLATAVQQAKELRDQRAESYALGQLGGLYEQAQQWDAAQQLTQQALVLAQTTNASDIAYRWQWQLGRVFKQREPGRANAEAIAAYAGAVKTLQSIRGDLLATNPEVQFSFREDVEPIYRELVELLVQPGASPTNLQQAREAIEALQVAELENFFRSACLKLAQPVDMIDQKAAVIYPILLDNQLVVILSLPGQPLRHYATNVPLRQVEDHLEKLHRSLVLPYTSETEIHALSEPVYNWIIKPAEADLANSKIETLVFVLDGALRRIPMAALYDGNQYLAEKYNLALTPGLRLFEPKRLAQSQLKALTAGLTEPRHNFAPLDFVSLELEQIQAKIPTEILLNQQFTSTTLTDKIESSPFPVVHIATHGQFSSQSDKTFILAWDQPITIDQLDRLLQVREQRSFDALELLVLSACETAEGDKRAALGLAGVAIRAGARSTVASLWLVDDESTALLMSQFYQELKTGATKAEALHRAQLTLLGGKYKHPRFWSAFVLLGNWL